MKVAFISKHEIPIDFSWGQQRIDSRIGQMLIIRKSATYAVYIDLSKLSRNTGTIM